MKTFQELLIELNACKDAREWAGDKAIEQVVQECHRGDWLLWLAKRVGVELQPLTLVKGHCACRKYIGDLIVKNVTQMLEAKQ